MNMNIVNIIVKDGGRHMVRLVALITFGEASFLVLSFVLHLYCFITHLNIRIGSVAFDVDWRQVSAPLDAHFQRAEPVVVQQRDLNLSSYRHVGPGALTRARIYRCHGLGANLKD